MTNWLEYDLGIKIVMGLIAGILTLTVWKATTAHNLAKQLQWLYRYRATGFCYTRINRLWYLSILAAVIRLCTLVSGVVILTYTVRYILLLHLYLEKFSSISSGSLTDFHTYLNRLQVRIIVSTFTAFFFAIFDFLVEFAIRLYSAYERGPIPTLSHPAVIPRPWRTAQIPLWEHRIEYALTEECGNAGELQAVLGDGAWLESWAEWTKCVVGYQIAAIRETGNVRENIREEDKNPSTE